jgi:hypothetical protein
LKEKPVRHCVVEYAENNSTVGKAIEAGMVGGGCEFTAANVTIDGKLELQADRIGAAAYETMIRAAVLITAHGGQTMSG